MNVRTATRGQFAMAELPRWGVLARVQRSKRKHRLLRSRPSACAFTLIEIMVVVAIMGLILAAGIPSLYGIFHKEGLRKSMSDLMDTCNSARRAAIMSGKDAELVIHPREGTCDVDGGGGQFGGWVHSVKLDRVKIWALQVNNSKMDLSQANEVRVRFLSNGTSEEMTMLLLGDNNEMKGLTPGNYHRPGASHDSGGHQRPSPLIMHFNFPRKSRRAFTLLEVMIAVGILFMCLFAVLALTANSLASARKLQQHKDLDAGTFESMFYTQLANTNQIDEGPAELDLGDEFANYPHTVDLEPYNTNGLWDVEYDVANPQKKAEVHGHFLVFNPNLRRGGGISRSLPHH